MDLYFVIISVLEDYNKMQCQNDRFKTKTFFDINMYLFIECKEQFL